MNMHKFLIDVVEQKLEDWYPEYGGSAPELVVRSYIVLGESAGDAFERFMTDENAGTLHSEVALDTDAFVCNIALVEQNALQV